MSAPETCRYDREIERSILEAGLTIKLNGKRINKKDLTETAKQPK